MRSTFTPSDTLPVSEPIRRISELPAHGVPLPDLMASLGSSVAGLTEREAGRRLRTYGLNRVDSQQRVSAWRVLRDQFRSLVVALLAAAAAMAAALGEPLEAAAIIVVLAVNAALGFVTEWRARRAMAALLGLEVFRAVVLRDGRLSAIGAEALVPGDVVEVNSGQSVPADGRVIQHSDLRTNEAPLTGESLPVSKAVGVVAVDTTLAERRNMAFKGTTVVAGTARLLVTATGASTEIGRVGVLMRQVAEGPAPVERRLDELGRRLVWIALSAAAVVASLRALQGDDLFAVAETAIALAVAAVPEALPAVATIALAVGIRRMSVRRALVRRLAAVEALGSATVVCTDKTRTLTSGDMTAVRLWTPHDDVRLLEEPPTALTATARQALAVAALASRPQVGDEGDEVDSARDPVDDAMLSAAARAGLNPEILHERKSAVSIVPFSSERKLMACFHREGPRFVAYVKGAPEHVLGLCDIERGGVRIDAVRRKALLAVNDGFAAGGMRVIALASGSVTAPSESAMTGLSFAGFVGLMDPPADGVREAVGRLREAGLRTLMLTGDQRLTAVAVGRQLQMLSSDAQATDGTALDALTPAELEQLVADVAVFSRITPEHKLKIVTALQARGEIVAMLGDGVNDAPALKKADVGVAMGKRGTDAAKAAAAIVLQDDRFETITAAVEEGRVIFDNIRKFVFYLFSCNLAEVLVLLGAGLLAWPVPLMPLQLLWLNMLTDTFPALALAVEPADGDVMRRPPRDPHEAILSKAFLSEILLYAVVLTLCVLAAYGWALVWRPAAAQTIAFLTLAFAQIFHLGNARSAGAVLNPAKAVANPYALGAVALSAALQLMAVSWWPVASVLRVTPLDTVAWGVVLAFSIVPATLGQALKLRRFVADAPARDRQVVPPSAAT